MKSSAIANGDTADKDQYNNLRQDAKGASYLLGHEKSTPDMGVTVEAGIGWVGSTLVNYSGGNSSSLVNPVTNPRIDVLTLDSTGTLAWVAGTEAASPSIPTVPANKIPICAVYLRTTGTTIRDTDQGSGHYIYRDMRIIMVSVESIPAFYQRIPLPLTTATDAQRAFGSSQDGSVIYIATIYGTAELQRYERDATTGMYFKTHQANMSTTIPSSDYGSIIEIGAYIYVFGNGGTNINCFRYSKTDLTGEQSITVPTVSSFDFAVAWSDGTQAYVVCSTTPTTVRRWTISGTTFTAAATSTLYADVTGYRTSAMYDGTNVYIAKISSTSLLIYKLTNIDGSTGSLVATKTLENIGGMANPIAYIIPHSSSKIYIGTENLDYNATVVSNSFFELFPIARP